MRISDWSSDVCSSDLDLDNFKQINDSFGHAAGDGVIAHFAAMLAEAAPASAIVGRIGGEEFAVLLPDALLSDGRLYAEAVRTDLKSVGSGKSVSVRVDLGGRRIIKTKQTENTQ